MAGYYSSLGTPAWERDRSPFWRGIYDTLGRLITAWKAERGDEPFDIKYEGTFHTPYLVGTDGTPFRKLQP